MTTFTVSYKRTGDLAKGTRTYDTISYARKRACATMLKDKKNRIYIFRDGMLDNTMFREDGTYYCMAEKPVSNDRYHNVPVVIDPKTGYVRRGWFVR